MYFQTAIDTDIENIRELEDTCLWGEILQPRRNRTLNDSIMQFNPGQAPLSATHREGTSRSQQATSLDGVQIRVTMELGHSVMLESGHSICYEAQRLQTSCN